LAAIEWGVTKQYMADTGVYGGGAANPGDMHMPIGKWDPGTGLAWVTRAIVWAPISFAGMTSINFGRLYFFQHTASGWHANGSGAQLMRFRRRTVDWSETSGGTSSAVDELWGGNGASIVVDYTQNDGIPDQYVDADVPDGYLTYVDITGAVNAWFNGAPNYGIKLEAVNESSYLGAFELYSRHYPGYQPYIYIDYNTNTPPNAPVNLSPTGSTIVHTGTSFTASGARSDPDAGDYISAYQVLTYRDDGATLILDTGAVYPGGAPTTFAHTLNVGGWGANAYYRWIARTADSSGVWGPYSAQQRVKLNTLPNVPVITGLPTNDLTPTFSGSASDPDAGDGMTQVQLEVRRQSDNALMWSSGDLAATGSSWSKTYAGSALSWSTGYKVRARIKDTNGAYSAWSDETWWVTYQPAGPTLSPRNPGVKTNDTTPDLTITYTENFTDHELYVYSNVGGTTQVFSSLPTAYTATTSMIVTVSPALTNGVTYYWKARVLIQSTGEWSQWAGFVTGQSGNLSAQFYINALPTSPTSLVVRNDINTLPIIRPSDGVYIVTTLTPLLTFVFNDPDQGPYGDAPANGDIEVYNNETGALHWSAANQASLNDGELTYAGTALVNETTYKFRVRFKDDSGSYGAWSNYVLFKPTQPSTLGSVTPVGTITAPAFECTWAHGSPSAKEQATYRVRVKRDSDGVDVYDTGTVNSSTESHSVPGGYLVNGTNYTITVDAVDTDGV